LKCCENINNSTSSTIKVLNIPLVPKPSNIQPTKTTKSIISVVKPNSASNTKQSTKAAKPIITSPILTNGNENVSIKLPQFQKSNILTSDNDSDNENDLISETTRKLRIPVTNKREQVLKYRNGRDLYTNKTISEIENPHVDHIVENQIISHALHNALLNPSLVVKFIDPMKKVINQNDNYNVTSCRINVSKGNCVRLFFSDGINRGFPLAAVVLNHACEAYIGKICEVMVSSHEILDPEIRACRHDNGRVNGNSDFEKIAEHLADILVDKMQIRMDDKRRLRPRRT
jgi:hypothetical protein